MTMIRQTVRRAPILVVVALLSCAGDAPARAPRPLLVVGIDGATWDVIDPMLEQGSLPNFARLVERGVRADLLCLPPLSSPVAWTTIATGRFGRDHNILDHTYPYGDGPKRTVDSTLRRVPALWNVAGEYDRRVGVVGYMATHPPEAVNGFMISGRAVEGDASSVHPPELEPLLRAELAALEPVAARRAVLRRFIGFDYHPRLVRDRSHPHHNAARVVAKRVDRRALHDELVRRLTLKMLGRGAGAEPAAAPDILITYLRMVDHASHAAWLYYDASDFDEKPTPQDVALLGDLIPATYRYMDAALGEFVSAAGDDWNVVVVSDHGFGSKTGIYAGGRSDSVLELTGNHRPNGIFLAAGPDLRRGVEIHDLALNDVAPMLFALAGLPLSDQLSGRVARDALRDDFGDDHPLRRVASYGASEAARVGRPGAGDADGEHERLALEALEALGYLETATPVAAGEPSPSSGFWDAAPRLVERTLLGEVLFYLLRDDREALASLGALVREHDPQLAVRVAHMAAGTIPQLEQEFGRPLFALRSLDAFDGTAPAEPAP